MLNFLGVVIGFIVMIWLLLFRQPSIEKTLAAWRWMLLAWGLLILVHHFSPIEYTFYQLSSSTLLYCALWVSLFVLGDELGYRSSRNLESRNANVSPAWSTTYYNRMILSLTVLSLVGLFLLGSATGIGSALGNGLDLSELRESQIGGTNEGIVKTVATLLASVGLVVSMVDLSSSITANRRIRWFPMTGFAAYLCIYVFVGGRSGWILGGVCLLVVFLASQQLLVGRYRHFRQLMALLAFVAILTVSYTAAVVTTRGQNWSGGMDNRIQLYNYMGGATLEENFRESLRPLNAAGDTIIEVFYYLSPQLYGLEHSFRYFRSGQLGWGIVQFPYITRRLEQILDVRLLEPIISQDKWSYQQFNLAPNFFRTAVHSTFVDFGLILGLSFMIGCGFLAGRNRASAVRLRSPWLIALQALICSGAAWTVIFSPFAEVGWAFPLLWFLILRALMVRPYPAKQGYRLNVARPRMTP